MGWWYYKDESLGDLKTQTQLLRGNTGNLNNEAELH